MANPAAEQAAYVVTEAEPASHPLPYVRVYVLSMSVICVNPWKEFIPWQLDDDDDTCCSMNVHIPLCVDLDADEAIHWSVPEHSAPVEVDDWTNVPTVSPSSRLPLYPVYRGLIVTLM